MTVVGNAPFAHSVASSTSSLPLPSRMSRDVHGSGTHAPSIAPDLNVSSVCELGWGLILTSPPPAVVVFSPFDLSHARKDTSWVFPSCGEAIVLPLRPAALLMPGLTTKPAPPDAAPAMMRTATPFDFW